MWFVFVPVREHGRENSLEIYKETCVVVLFPVFVHGLRCEAVLFGIPVRFTGTDPPRVCVRCGQLFLRAVLHLPLVLYVLLPFFSLVEGKRSKDSKAGPAAPSEIPLVHGVLDGMLETVSLALRSSVLLVMAVSAPTLSTGSY